MALAFASHPAGHTDPRVPPGLNYYTLQAKLSELQIIFLYRFLQEILQYISVMLALRLAPEGAEQVPEALPATSPADQKLLDGQQQVASPPPAAAQQPQTQQAQQQQPFVLVMDIEMNAPVISLPRSSDSTDGISVDLGNLHLRSTVDTSNISANGTGALVEVAELTFSGVECSVVQAGRQGPSVIRNPEQGWQLRWRRPLVPECRGEAPFVSCPP